MNNYTRLNVNALFAEMCPAVALVDGCRYAVNELGLKLDGEALDLCNRHQLCYTCVSIDHSE